VETLTQGGESTLKISDFKLLPYQLACIYKIQSDIEQGKTRIFINMPTGSGKIITIISFFNKFLEENERVLFLHSASLLAEQSKYLLSQYL